MFSNNSRKGIITITNQSKTNKEAVKRAQSVNKLKRWKTRIKKKNHNLFYKEKLGFCFPGIKTASKVTRSFWSRHSVLLWNNNQICHSIGKLLPWCYLIFSTLVSSFFVRPRAAMIINVFPKQTKLNCGRKFWPNIGQPSLKLQDLAFSLK